MKLQRQPVAVAVDERIDAACVRLELASLIRRKRCSSAISCGAELQITLHLVVQDEAGAENLGELSGGVTAQRVHLPQAILRGDVTLREEQIFHAGGVNGWNALRIARDSDRCVETVDRECAVYGRQHGSHHVSRPDRPGDDESGHDDEENDERKEESAKNSSASAGPGSVYATNDRHPRA